MWDRIRFPQLLAGILLLGFLARLVYVLRQAAFDPTFALPILDGAYYMEWARALASGHAGPLAGHPHETAGAFYLAPLYPLALSLWLRAFGDGPWLLHYAQEILMLGAAAALGLAGRRLAGEGAGLAAALLVLTYHPLLFFAARPLGEALAIALLAAALLCETRAESATAAGAAGWLAGLACLARPNLLLVPLAWGARRALARDAKGTALLAAGLVVALSPVAARNFSASGHPVLVSSNGGLTFYHGNREGARGIGSFAAGLSGRLSEQRREATRIAEFYEGREMDPVQADHWWGVRALADRAAAPLDSVALLARRAVLTMSNAEISLDYAPQLDTNPWRRLAPLPFAAIFGLAAAGVYLRGWRGTGGAALWCALAACAVTPLAFYVTSRYRLPLAFLLCLPAGAGCAGLLAAATPAARRRKALVLAAVAAAASVLAPTGGLADVGQAAALANRARAWQRQGMLKFAEQDCKRALALDPDSVPALDALAAIVAPSRRETEFDPYYRRALEAHPATPGERWTAVVLSHVATGEVGLAWRAADQARREGAELDPELLDRLRLALQGETP